MGRPEVPTRSHENLILSEVDREKFQSMLWVTVFTLPTEEMEVVDLFLRGYMQSEMADRFGVSRKTIWNRLQSAFKRIREGHTGDELRRYWESS